MSTASVRPHAPRLHAVERRAGEVDAGQVQLVEHAAAQHPRRPVAAVQPLAHPLGVGRREVDVAHLGARVERGERIGHGPQSGPQPGITAPEGTPAATYSW